MKIHGEIEYKGKDGGWIHSDICPGDCDLRNMNDPEYVEFLHASLDEWLKNSNGTGQFYIKQEGYGIAGWNDCDPTQDNDSGFEKVEYEDPYK